MLEHKRLAKLKGTLLFYWVIKLMKLRSCKSLIDCNNCSLKGGLILLISKVAGFRSFKEAFLTYQVISRQNYSQSEYIASVPFSICSSAFSEQHPIMRCIKLIFRSCVGNKYFIQEIFQTCLFVAGCSNTVYTSFIGSP